MQFGSGRDASTPLDDARQVLVSAYWRHANVTGRCRKLIGADLALRIRGGATQNFDRALLAPTDAAAGATATTKTGVGAVPRVSSAAAAGGNAKAYQLVLNLLGGEKLTFTPGAAVDVDLGGRAAALQHRFAGGLVDSGGPVDEPIRLFGAVLDGAGTQAPPPVAPLSQLSAPAAAPGVTASASDTFDASTPSAAAASNVAESAQAAARRQQKAAEWERKQRRMSELAAAVTRDPHDPGHRFAAASYAWDLLPPDETCPRTATEPLRHVAAGLKHSPSDKRLRRLQARIRDEIAQATAPR